jgi:hypothetical protein
VGKTLKRLPALNPDTSGALNKGRQEMAHLPGNTDFWNAGPQVEEIFISSRIPQNLWDGVSILTPQRIIVSISMNFFNCSVCTLTVHICVKICATTHCYKRRLNTHIHIYVYMCVYIYTGCLTTV